MIPSSGNEQRTALNCIFYFGAIPTSSALRILSPERQLDMAKAGRNPYSHAERSLFETHWTASDRNNEIYEKRSGKSELR